ncbi:helix-turn-helix transcriptional regulator [Sphingoaurantiacus capsulatus]|uniref:Helix-turn-helix transcriptional regulator n=1 Tax=Sphingoaurantiacus capsulatus TaxID=1771310 RepID=A0ABV7X7B7_9SPHN
MRASRLLSILILLQLRGRLTADALAAEFEVSVRTIYRDIDALSAAGVPVYGDRGPGGGFELLDGYRTRLTGLSAAEAEALFMIGLPGPAAALGIGPAASVAGNKLLAALPSGAGDAAGRIGSRFHLDPVNWYRAADSVPHLPAVGRAVLDEVRVTMRYESWTGERDWEVEPVGVVLKAGAWYMVARGAGKLRIFRVSNLRAFAATEEKFVRPADFDLATFWTEEMARFETELRPGIAVVDATAEGLIRLAGLGAFAEVAVAAAEGNRVRLPIETIGQAALMLLGVGPEIDVIDPPELRTALAALAGQVVARHAAALPELSHAAYMASDDRLAESPEPS